MANDVTLDDLNTLARAGMIFINHALENSEDNVQTLEMITSITNAYMEALEQQRQWEANHRIRGLATNQVIYDEAGPVYPDVDSFIEGLDEEDLPDDET